MADNAVQPFLDGLDHIVLAVHDLSAAAERWRALGFTVSPPGLHSAYLGTGNHTVMLEDDYIELLGVLNSTDFNRPTRDFLDRGEGLERLAMRGIDAQRAVQALHAAGVAGTGPFEFRRPVSLPGGGESEAAFRIFSWPDLPAPGGVRVFACQHLTRDTVWLPELTSHPNGARALERVEIRADDPEAEARTLAEMLGLDLSREEDGGWRVTMRPRGADIVFRPLSGFAKLWGEPSSACAITVATSNPEAARAWAQRHKRSGECEAVDLGPVSVAFVSGGEASTRQTKKH